ncbi:MAG: hypothetical protein HYW90_00980 [Candidatus Sungbacteria bacterium]|nr:hypothetical protein [Candidatus Sungbacteria bacterium]
MGGLRALCGALLLLASATSVLAAETDDKRQPGAERFVPKFFEVDLSARPERFVSGELIMLDGVIAYDQLFNVHWDELVPEKLKLAPFKVVKANVGPEQPSWRSREAFVNERPVSIVLQLEDKKLSGLVAIPAFAVSYSWQDGERVVTKKAKIGPWKVERVLLKVSVSASPKVLHLGEEVELTARIASDGVKILNQFIGVLKDEKASEAAKAEVKRWLKSLEARKDSAFNPEAPDVKPFTVLGRSSEEVRSGNYALALYRYRIAYYETAGKPVRLPPVKVWYVASGAGAGSTGGYAEPKSVSAAVPEFFIASRLSGNDRRLDGPVFPKRRERNAFTVYFFDYGLFAASIGFFLLGAVLLFGRRAGVFRGEKTKRVKPVSFRRASRELVSFLNPVWNGGNLSERGVKIFRERLVALVGSGLGMLNEEAQAKSADEMAALLEEKFGKDYVLPVTDLLRWCDRALSLSETGDKFVSLPEGMISKAGSFLRSKSSWRSSSESVWPPVPF